MAIHSGILAWRIPWREDPGGTLCSVAESDRTEATWHACILKKERERGVGSAGGKRREVSSSQSP